MKRENVERKKDPNVPARSGGRRTLDRRRTPVRLWMICGILVCMTFGVPSWSRYRAQVVSSGQAVIACLAVGSEINIDAGTLPKKPGTSTQVIFAVTNEENGKVSETELRYHVTPETGENLPLTFTLTQDPSKGPADDNWISDGSTVAANTASVEGTFPPGQGAVHRYIMTIGWPEDQESDNADYADEIDYVRLKIRAVQASPR